MTRQASKYDKYYKTKRWKTLREYILRRDKYMCQDSIRYGMSVEANTVHHIFPADEYPELFYEPDNLISLSNKAHNKMHDRITNKISNYGKDLQARTKRKVFKLGERGK